MKAYHVTDAHFDEQGQLVIDKKRGTISKEELDAISERFKDFLLKVQGTEESSYDNSDDERVTDSYSEYKFTSYFELDPMNNCEHLLRVDGEIKGVCFTITPKLSSSGIRRRAFFFDDSISECFSLGYSASHSSSYTHVDSVVLVKRGLDGAPNEGRNIRFEQHELYPSF